MSNQKKAFILAGATILAWSTVSTAFKVSLESLTPMQLIYVSMLTACIVMLGITTFQRQLHVFRAMTLRQWGSAICMGVMLYSYYTLLFVAYDRLPAQIAQPINNTWALMLALLSALLLKQKLTMKEFFWMLFAYSGVVIITSGASSSLGPLNPTGLCCVIASTLIYALYWIVNTKSNLPVMQGLTICFFVSFVLALCTLFLTKTDIILPVRPVLSAVYVGLFELSIPFLLWGQALRLTSSISRISSLPFLVPFLAMFWINLVLGESIAWTTILGLFIIITGTAMQQHISAQRSKTTN